MAARSVWREGRGRARRRYPGAVDKGARRREGRLTQVLGRAAEARAAAGVQRRRRLVVRIDGNDAARLHLWPRDLALLVGRRRRRRRDGQTGHQSRRALRAAGARADRLRALALEARARVLQVAQRRRLVRRRLRRRRRPVRPSRGERGGSVAVVQSSAPLARPLEVHLRAPPRHGLALRASVRRALLAPVRGRGGALLRVRLCALGRRGPRRRRPASAQRRNAAGQLHTLRRRTCEAGQWERDPQQRRTIAEPRGHREV